MSFFDELMNGECRPPIEPIPKRHHTPRVHTGDMWGLWDTWGYHPGAVLVITVNSTRTSPGGDPIKKNKYGVMGKGCALAAARRYPALAAWWSARVAGGGDPPTGWHCSPLNPDPMEPTLDRRVGVLVTKLNWWEQSCPALIVQGLTELVAWADECSKAGRDRYVMPLPGAGCGGLSKELTKTLCREHLDSRFVVCTGEAFGA